MGIFIIDPAAGRNDNQARAFFLCLSNGFCCLDTIGTCRHGFGKDDPMTAFPVSSNSRGDRAEILCLS